MIDEDGNRHETPAAPAIPPHMRDGAHTATQRKAFGVVEEPTPTRSAKKTSARKATKRAAKKAAEEPVWPEK